MIKTITINQWRIADNAKNADNLPVICVNTYENKVRGVFGPKIGDTEHFHTLSLPEAAQVVYDPINKTPCGASCWIEVTYVE